MYNNEELIITPEFQRTFRWNEGQQSRFIESLILELPIPPVFVVEKENGEYELVDGLQRISTWLHFRGKLPRRFIEDKDKPHAGYDEDEEYVEATVSPEVNEDVPDTHLKKEGPVLRLMGCEIIHELNGMTFDDLPFSTQIALKRYFVRMHAVRRASREDLKYHMFKRLNQGGSPLSPQELRNCFIRIVNDDFIRMINKCSANSHFWACVRSISQNAADQLYHQELVLRFFAFKNFREHFVHDIGPFLDRYLEGVSRVGGKQLEFDPQQERLIFEKTFEVLARASGVEAFRAFTKNVGTGAFRSLLYESITLGIQDVLPFIDPANDEHIGVLSEALDNVKKDAAFQQLTTGGGKNTKTELERRIDKVRSTMHLHFSPMFSLTPFVSTVPVRKAKKKDTPTKKQGRNP
jgi:hypothetical protein